MKVIQKDPRVPFRLKPEHEADIDRQVAEAVEDQVIKTLSGDNPTAVPTEFVEHLKKSLKDQAVAVLTKIHDKQMARRVAHLGTTCRMDGCDKQPRKGLRQVQHKGRKRTFVFCKEHAGVRNQIAKSDYQRLKSDASLRVVAS